MKNFSELRLPEFAPGAKYIAPMDCLIYLREDCSYRAVRLDPLRTVLLHPTEDRPVGIKLKGMRNVFERYRAILHSLNMNVDHVTLWTLWETACAMDGDDLVETADVERRRQYALRAGQMLETAGQVDSSELPIAAQ
jgi:hypothetical protein